MPDGTATATAIETIVENAGDILDAELSMATSVGNWILGNPLALFLIGVSVVGLVFVGFRALIGSAKIGR